MYQSSASLAFVRGIRRSPLNSPLNWPVTRIMFPFDDGIMIGRQLHLQAINCRATNQTLPKTWVTGGSIKRGSKGRGIWLTMADSPLTLRCPKFVWWWMWIRYIICNCENRVQIAHLTLCKQLSIAGNSNCFGIPFLSAMDWNDFAHLKIMIINSCRKSANPIVSRNFQSKQGIWLYRLLTSVSR